MTELTTGTCRRGRTSSFFPDMADKLAPLPGTAVGTAAAETGIEVSDAVVRRLRIVAAAASKRPQVQAVVLVCMGGMA